MSEMYAGFYSVSFKINKDENEDPQRNISIIPKHIKIKAMKDDPDDDYYKTSSLLPPPIHYGKILCTKVSDFQLPYDIWSEVKPINYDRRHSSLNNYKRIRMNVFYDAKPISSEKAQRCLCVKPEDGRKGCDADCLNRVCFVECRPSICPCQEKCSNRQIQNHEWFQGLERFLTVSCGWGVRTTKSIPKGTFILEYLGEVISVAEFKRRMVEEYVNDTHHYCLSLDSQTVIDGYRMGSECRFVNHSCEPNCEMQKWSVNGLYRVALFSKRDIKPGEELSYDYNFDYFNLNAKQTCRCGSANCRGVIGAKRKSPTNSHTISKGCSGKITAVGKCGKESLRDKKQFTKQPTKINSFQ